MRTTTLISLVALTTLPASAFAQAEMVFPAEIAPRPGARQAQFRAAPGVQAFAYLLAPTVTPAVKPDKNASGYIAQTPVLPRHAGLWENDARGRWVYAFEFTSPDAAFLRVRFGEDLDESLLLYIYDPVSGATFGPYERHQLARTDFWSTIIFGDSIGVEVIAPGDAPPPPPPDAPFVNHGYVPFGDMARGCVHRDVSCEPTWQGPADAVCVLATVNMSGGISTFCSGALMNRSANDGSPIVMTANHCLGSQGAAGPTSYIWFWQSDACNGSLPAMNTLPRSDGSLMLKRHSPSDWNIVGLYEPPAAAYYMGFSAGYWDDGASATGIHHPGGDFKRIAFGTKTDDDVGIFCDQNGQNCFEAATWEVDFSLGFTIPGSSGSPIMSGVGIVRGTLTGGPQDDCTISRYGRLDHAYTNVRWYLNNIASPVYVAVGPGDPGNNGSSERGTSPQPFNTVQEATFAVIEGDDVAIGPGNYNEQFTVWRPMTLRRAGSTGIVRIGN
jgi:hypothetical protein